MSRIVTVTLNPSLDTTAMADRVEPDRKIRCTEARRDPGGGGINVARAIGHLGGEAVAVWARGGMFGELLHEMLSSRGIAHAPVDIAGENRQSFAVVEADSERHFRFSTPGPSLTTEELDHLADDVHRQGPTILVLSGGLTEGVPNDYYAHLASSEVAGNAYVVLDTHGDALSATLDARVVDVVKPNYRELAMTVGADPDSEHFDVIDASRSLIDSGRAAGVVVSLGAAGAIAVTDELSQRISAPTVPIRSRIGAGDSMVAGLVFQLASGASLIDSARFGVAAGSAAVMTPGTELCRPQDVERVLADIPS